MKEFLRKKLKSFIGISELENNIDQIKYLNGKKLIDKIVSRANDISNCKVGVFSQGEEDSVIQFIISRINIMNKTFIELGSSNYKESNTRFLLLNNKWNGLIVDGSSVNINEIKKSYFYWKYPLEAKEKFITTANILETINEFKKDKKFGLLSVDLDGNDYWILKKILENGYIFDIIICEYNSLLGKKESISIKYNHNFIREQNENIINYGASIKAFKNLLNNNYKLIYGNQLGNNIFFVNRSFNEISEKSIDNCFNKSLFDEFSVKRGYKLTYEELIKKLNFNNFIEV